MNPVRLIIPRRFEDERGWFAETFSARSYPGLGVDVAFVQDNQSLSRQKGVLRGLHFQRPPHAQAKLVRCSRGRIFDVAVDIRGGSPTFGRWVGAELSADNMRQLYVPAGFAHGFLTLEANCEVIYKVSDFYAPECDDGLVWNDADMAIGWPLEAGLSPQLSPKDLGLPGLRGFQSPFAYDGNPLEPLPA
jgi:dTDP-4-dehydrorhamnose 3,5-epimerase